MKRRTYVTTGALFMGLIVLLGVMGVVSGLWSKNLVINGSVTTGDLNADWDCGYTNDDGLTGAAGVVQGGGCAAATVEPAGDTGADPHGGFPPFPYSDPFVSKDVAECRLTIGDQAGQPKTGFGNQVATVKIVNAYPSYECTTSMFLTNTGSIPFNIVGSNLSIAQGAPIEAKGCTFGTQTAQVDPGQEKQLDCTVHVLQTAKQNTCTGTTAASATTPPFPVVTENCTNTPLTTYTFGIEVCVAQWNEAATFTQCKGSPQHEGPGPEVGIVGIGVCGDGLDNDLDGFIDAADSGCLPPI